MKKKLIILAVFISMLSGGLYLFQRLNQTDNSSPLVLYGNVDVRDVVLGFRVSGRIKTLHYEEGDRVKKDDVLAVLDKIPFEKDLALRNAELAEAKAAFVQAQKNYIRRKELVKKGNTSKSDYDSALAARDEAKSRIEAAKARLELAQTRLNDTEINSPSTGIIQTRIREPGSIVSEGTPVYSLVLDTPVWVRTYIDEPNLGHIFPGQKAIVYTDSGQQYEGQIGYISPQAEFTPKNVETTQLRTSLVYRLRVIVDNPNHGLRQGMPVTVEIEKKN